MFRQICLSVIFAVFLFSAGTGLFTLLSSSIPPLGRGTIFWETPQRGVIRVAGGAVAAAGAVCVGLSYLLYKRVRTGTLRSDTNSAERAMPEKDVKVTDANFKVTDANFKVTDANLKVTEPNLKVTEAQVTQTAFKDTEPKMKVIEPRFKVARVRNEVNQTTQENSKQPGARDDVI